MEKQEEDKTFNGGLVKVENDEIDTKYESIEESKQDLIERSSKGLLESQEKVKELELELEKVTEELKQYETENSLLKNQLFSTKGKFEETKKKHEELEVIKKTLQEQIVLSVEMEKNRNVAIEKRKFAEEKLEKQARELDESTTKNIELDALHRHSELKFHKAMEDYSSMTKKAKSLTEELKDFEERIRLYEEKLAEASSQSLALKEELYQSSSENELLADTNNQLKMKIQDLNFEKETASERFNQKDREAKDLIIKLKSNENLIEEMKRQLIEASGAADTRKVEIEEALLKLKTLESTIEELEKENGSLAEVNLKLNQELANHGSKTRDFQEIVSASEAEKDQTVKELQKTIDDLTKQLTSERARLRSQISSLVEENNQVNEIYDSTKIELVKLQEQLQVDKSKSDEMVSKIEKLSAVAAEKSLLESNLKEVEKQLKNVQARLQEEVEKTAELTSKLLEHEHKASDQDEHKELESSHSVIYEQREAISQKHSELEANLNILQEELEAKKSMIIHLESLLKELEQKVNLVDAKSKEIESPAKREVEVRSRDIDLSFSSPTQRKSKKKSDTFLSHSSSSDNITIQTTETSHLMTLKMVGLGVGMIFVSVIIGIILGKQY